MTSTIPLPFLVSQPHFSKSSLVTIVSQGKAIVLDAKSGSQVFVHTVPQKFYILSAAMYQVNNVDILVLTSDDKTVAIFSNANNVWAKRATCTSLKKKIGRSLFATNKTVVEVLLADKFGDVWSTGDVTPYLNATEPVIIKECALRFGHVSQLMDMVMSPKENFVVTCDRDEKIKVSNFPNVFDIESFCMGHKTVVTRLNIVPFEGKEYLISGSLDRTLRMWDYTNPSSKNIVSVINVEKPFPFAQAISSTVISNSEVYIAVLFEKDTSVSLFKVQNQNNQVSLVSAGAFDLQTEVVDLHFVTSASNERLLVALTFAAPCIRVLQLQSQGALAEYKGASVVSAALSAHVTLDNSLSYEYFSKTYKKGEETKQKKNMLFEKNKKQKEEELQAAGSDDDDEDEDVEDDGEEDTEEKPAKKAKKE